ncbi:hypothetical protein AT746_16820 [Lacimicrobium alkaliphilum]|uniref:Uncharacterized protein n=1 Tax=Lacimicrobium alkaliphilum TaxID=1526571 RepID=A0A0U3BDP3_9ALTE|nr:hypothetical protein AT746_16820 [Lacimicrobium alkaliphilum]
MSTGKLMLLPFSEWMVIGSAKTPEDVSSSDTISKTLAIILVILISLNLIGRRKSRKGLQLQKFAAKKTLFAVGLAGY